MTQRESKHVALKEHFMWQKLFCLTDTLCRVWTDKHIGMTNIKKKNIMTRSSQLCRFKLTRIWHNHVLLLRQKKTNPSFAILYILNDFNLTVCNWKCTWHVSLPCQWQTGRESEKWDQPTKHQRPNEATNQPELQKSGNSARKLSHACLPKQVWDFPCDNGFPFLAECTNVFILRYCAASASMSFWDGVGKILVHCLSGVSAQGNRITWAKSLTKVTQVKPLSCRGHGPFPVFVSYLAICLITSNENILHVLQNNEKPITFLKEN